MPARKTKRPLYNVLESVKLTNSLFDLAKEHKGSAQLESQLLSGFLHSGISEFIAYRIVEYLELIVEGSCFAVDPDGIGLELKQEDRKLNLGGLIETLKRYSFPQKDKLLGLLIKIKKSRNNLFHNLIDGHDHGIEISKEVRNIEKHTDQLIHFFLNNHSYFVDDLQKIRTKSNTALKKQRPSK